MNLNFTQALQNLGADFDFELANTARPPGDYLFATLLPERTRETYTVDGGHMTIRSTMAGLSGTDSAYPESGLVEVSRFLHESAKLANQVSLNEKTLRELQQMVLRIAAQGGNTITAIETNILNFLDKLIIQPHLDVMEWLRGLALVNGEIDWTYNNKNLKVDYGLPASHMLPERTGTEAYNNADSMFWDDVHTARDLLRQRIRAAIAHPETIWAITRNPANNIRILAEGGGGTVTIQRLERRGDANSPTFTESGDVRDRIQLIGYDLEGDIFHPATNETINVPFMPYGKILFVAENRRSEFRIDEGSTDDPEQDLSLGYTHLAPTVEGGGSPGRWARVYTPENRPYMLQGQGVTNGLPVIRTPDKVVVSTTEMPA